MKTNKINQNWVMLLLMFMGISTLTLAQTPTTDLATHQPTAATPSGSTFEWHNALPIGAGNLMTSSQVAAAVPGLYYGVYNFSTCYSSPSSLRIATNTCPSTTTDLRTLVDSTAKPAGTFVSYHSGSPATSANRISSSTASTATAGTYFVAYFDQTGLCFTNTSPIIVVNSSCTNPLTITQPATITKPVSTLVQGTAPTDLLLSGGTGAIIYSNGSSDPACIAPSGATALSSPLTINSSTGQYSFTTPSTPGTYYFCVKVCDSTSPTPDCKVAIYKVVVLPPPCNVGTMAPRIN